MFEKPLGGTELMLEELKRRLDPSILQEFCIFNYAGQADFSKRMIYWNQLSYDQEAVSFLSYAENINRIEKFVFVSHWQCEQFRKKFRIPGEKSCVIKNACLGVPQWIPRKGKIRLCYLSTPWRGLDVLLRAWEMLSLDPEEFELHIFSSCKIYGPEYSSEDQKYQYLYDWCSRLPGVIYRGSIPNELLRAELSEFDILAYPCTFEETSCISLIDSLSAGLRAVCSSIGAIPETSEGWTRIYSYIEDRESHARVFSEVLRDEVNSVRKADSDSILSTQSREYGERWSWDSRILEWNKMIEKLRIVDGK